MNKKELIAPIIIVIIMSALIVLWFYGLFFVPMPLFIKLVILLVMLSIIGALIAVLVQRINELRKGEEKDAISKY